ncbi:MAG: class I adenylate-forming enzyme family protein [Lachnospiraceae bacterium]|nr:class I adenylate-forming enzyme family protein [Lachnospiraceae bacterium]
MIESAINSKDIKRVLPSWARVDRVVNNTAIYNMDIFENIMSFNQYNLDGPAVDYFGTVITYGEMVQLRDAYARGLKMLGVEEGDVVTLCLPVGIENLMLLFACNKLGAISNNVNFLFLKHDFARYTRDKKSKIIVTLDAYLPYFVEHLEHSHVKKVLIMNMDDFLPDEKKGMFLDTSKMPKKMRKVFDIKQITECMMNLDKVRGVDFIRLHDILNAGLHSVIGLPKGPVDMNRDISYYYTSGTTGDPKCVVYKEHSVNAYLEMHAGLDTKDYVGQRCLQVIPLTHMTGERVCAYQPLARGGCLVPYPIYNKDSFAHDLVESKAEYVVAAASFYLAAVKQGVIGPEALSRLRRPGSGGEPMTKSGVRQVDEWLRANGCNVRYSLGGGASEEGGATLVTYFMNEETKTNETGMPLKPFIKLKLEDENGNPVPQGQKGFLFASSPAAADRYLDDEEATAARWYIGEDGIRWGVTGDIAVENPDGSYNILGRASDSYINENGERIFLFDTEYALDPEDPINQWEITAFKVEDGMHEVVAQIVLKNGCDRDKAELVSYICKKYGVHAVKYYDEFELGEVTGKRDYLLLLQDYEGYYSPCDDTHLYKVTYSEDGTTSRKKISNEEASRQIG